MILCFKKPHFDITTNKSQKLGARTWKSPEKEHRKRFRFTISPSPVKAKAKQEDQHNRDAHHSYGRLG
ncbi:hypothetical protein ILYODFUR_036066 [Ilyodon furcidens]|uniref:Uncharacterized protein n=1 Tax=Ilyodon furcidens TaxID=33524 RepID=A0ABV0VJZ1_9TELE